jgi:two-component system, cell cycle sensor histidine kinase and response regulator CckA
MRVAIPVSKLTVKLRYFKRLWLGMHLVPQANHVRSRLMKGIEGYAGGTPTPQTDAPLPITVWVAALAAVVAFTGLVSIAGPDAIGLATLILLAVVGLFFLFGAMAGYVQFDSGAARRHIERAVSASATTATEVTAIDGEVLFANPAADALRGVRAGSLEAAIAGHFGSSDAAYRLARAAERFETHSEVIAKAAAVDGPTQWLRVTVQPFRAPTLVSDARRMVQWTAVDITAERHREAATAAKVQAQSSFLDSLPIGVALVGVDGVFGQMNTAMRRLLRADDVAGRALTLADVLPPSMAPIVERASRNADGKPTGVTLDIVREDGTNAPVRLVVQPAPAGSPWTLVALEQTAAASADTIGQPSTDDRFQRVFNAAPFGVATIDQDGRVINANASFLRMFPDSAGATSILKRLASNASADQRKAVEAALVRALSGRISSSAVDIVSGDAAQTARSLHIQPLTIGLDPREAAVIYVADATEHKALEMKFAQSQRMEAVGKLAGGIAHDFNNVLTVIIGLADLLLQTRRPTDNGFADLIQIRDNGRRAANMVKQLLAFSRKQTLEPEVIGINELLQDFAFTFKKTIGEQIDVKHVPVRDLWPVKADRTQLDQVLLNLAVNAKDAMPTGGRLRLRAKNITERESLKYGGIGMLAGEYVLIEAEDNGTGMTQEVMTKIFEPFYTTKDVGKGTGLGLSTVYGIIKQTGGFIYPVSEVGRGTTFRVFLPRYIATEQEEQDAAVAAEAKKKELPRDLTGTGRVLLVEDEDGVRSFAVRALQRQGYDVLEAISGVDALDVMAEVDGKVDLIVSDVIMPEMDGPTMYNEMLKTWPGLKIIFMSGYPSDAFERALTPEAEFAFLQKPVNLVQLAAKVKEVMTG